MSKFLILWEGVPGYMPADPKERAVIIGKMMEMTKKALAERQVKDWGLFPEGDAGYSVVEGTEADVLKISLQFTPYIRGKVHSVLSLKEVGEVMKSMK
jgi:hypothetical protein